MTRRSTRGGVQLTTDKVIPVIYEQYGNLAAVARKLGTSRQHMYTFVNQHATVQQALADARESMIDNAESSLYKQALDGNVTALIFFLKTQGYHRGYTERQHHTIDMTIRQEAERLAQEYGLNVDEVMAEAERIVKAT